MGDAWEHKELADALLGGGLSSSPHQYCVSTKPFFIERKQATAFVFTRRYGRISRCGQYCILREHASKCIHSDSLTWQCSA